MKFCLRSLPRWICSCVTASSNVDPFTARGEEVAAAARQQSEPESSDAFNNGLKRITSGHVDGSRRGLTAINDDSLSTPSSTHSVGSMQSAEEDDSEFYDARSMFSCSSGGFGPLPETARRTIASPRGEAAAGGSMTIVRRTSSSGDVITSLDLQHRHEWPFPVTQADVAGAPRVPTSIAHVLSKSLGKCIMFYYGFPIAYYSYYWLLLNTYRWWIICVDNLFRNHDSRPGRSLHAGSYSYWPGRLLGEGTNICSQTTQNLFHPP